MYTYTSMTYTPNNTSWSHKIWLVFIASFRINNHNFLEFSALACKVNNNIVVSRTSWTAVWYKIYCIGDTLVNPKKKCLFKIVRYLYYNIPIYSIDCIWIYFIRYSLMSHIKLFMLLPNYNNNSVNRKFTFACYTTQSRQTVYFNEIFVKKKIV